MAAETTAVGEAVVLAVEDVVSEVVAEMGLGRWVAVEEEMALAAAATEVEVVTTRKAQ